MQKKILKSEILVYNGKEELNADDRELINVAQLAATKAYAPYSGFNVGAAVRLSSGVITSGNNQENAAYPSGLCAERVALFYASSQWPDEKVVALAITAHSSKIPVSPCGACRQVIAEYETRSGSPIRLIMGGQNGEVFVCESATGLLPLSFSRNNLV